MALRRILAFVCMTCLAALASAGTPKFVDIPADDLTDAVELLARQYEVDVIYPSDLLRGRDTQGVHGAFEAADAFRKLLESTPFVLSKEGEALLITGPSQQATTRTIADGLPEVRVEAWWAAAKAGDQPTPKREPIFGWARHNAERQRARAITQALDSTCQRLAKKGDEKIQVYCIIAAANPHRSQSVRTARKPDAASGDASCRRLIKPGSNRIQGVCGNRALWEEFDIRAVNAGVTCRLPGTSQELCLTVAQWTLFGGNPVRRGVDSSASGLSSWPGNNSLETNNPGYQGGGGSYGYFPQGTSIGATTAAGPPR